MVAGIGNDFRSHVQPTVVAYDGTFRTRNDGPGPTCGARRIEPAAKIRIRYGNVFKREEVNWLKYACVRRC